jgi:ornithine carbamoyltransferase
MGIHFTACAPEKYFPDKELIATCKKLAEKSGATLKFDTDPIRATKNADVIYTDVWVSMGEPYEVWEERLKELYPYQVNKAAMNMASEGAVFMHCLPAFHDLKTGVGKEIGEKFGLDALEVTDDVFE